MKKEQRACLVPCTDFRWKIQLHPSLRFCWLHKRPSSGGCISQFRPDNPGGSHLADPPQAVNPEIPSVPFLCIKMQGTSFVHLWRWWWWGVLTHKHDFERYYYIWYWGDLIILSEHTCQIISIFGYSTWASSFSGRATVAVSAHRS